MMKPKLPEGLNEEDYEAIEAAVTETARGREFLAEFARRSRVDEMRQMLDAMARLEQIVTSNQKMPADPSNRLLVARLREIGEALNRVAETMRAQGLEKYSSSIEAQARALTGLLRLNGPAPQREAAPAEIAPSAEPRALASEDVRAISPPAPVICAPVAEGETINQAGSDRRRAALAAIDRLPTLEKLRLFA
jgi:hypothetical protein